MFHKKKVHNLLHVVTVSPSRRFSDRPIPLALGAPLHLGLAWEFVPGHALDLDATAVVLDVFGNVLDAAYFNQLSALGGDPAAQYCNNGLSQQRL